MLLLRLFRPPHPTVPVKEVMDARPCRACGRPTWSLIQVCVACKRGLAPGQLAAVARRRFAASGRDRRHELADVEEILAFFPPTIRRRFIRRLFMERLMVPPSVIIGLMAAASFTTLALGAAIAAMIASVFIDAMEPPFLRSIAWTMLVPSFISLPVIGVARITWHSFAGLRRELAHGVMAWTGDEVRCTVCPNCAHDQGGTVDTVCPECACPIGFG